MNKFYTKIVILFLTSTLFINASTSNLNHSKISILVQQQQYLAKEIPKDYKNSNTKKKMHNNISKFDKNHLQLLQYKKNTKLINQKLKEISKVWGITKDLTKSKELPKIIQSAMGDISKIMKEVRTLYKKISK